MFVICFLIHLSKRYGFMLMTFAIPHYYCFCQSPHFIDSPQFSTIPPCLLNSFLSRTLVLMSRTILHYFPDRQTRNNVNWNNQHYHRGDGCCILPIMSGNVNSPAVWMAAWSIFPAHRSNDILSEYSMLLYAAHLNAPQGQRYLYSLLQEPDQLLFTLVCLF